MLTRVDSSLAKTWRPRPWTERAQQGPYLLNQSVPADGNAAQYQPNPTREPRARSLL